MIGIVVVSHARLAIELRRAAELILGPQTALETVSIDRDMALKQAQRKLSQALDTVGRDGDGVIILTDLFGGTPTNISVEFLVDKQVEILTGVNLPMLIKCVSARCGYDLDGLTTYLKGYAQDAIMRPADLLR